MNSPKPLFLRLYIIYENKGSANNLNSNTTYERKPRLG